MAQNEMTYERFEAAAKAEGFDEVLVREWQPDQVLGTHRHPFAVKALVTRGEVWLTEGEQVRHLRAGDGFELARDVPHAERYGEDGATFWVARRNGAITPG
jgi:quercetin dioxygenase-like cupin family protein